MGDREEEGAWCAVAHVVPEWDMSEQLDCLDAFVDSLDHIREGVLFGPSVLFINLL